jgi:hypothetical protein
MMIVMLDANNENDEIDGSDDNDYDDCDDIDYNMITPSTNEQFYLSIYHHHDNFTYIKNAILSYN